MRSALLATSLLCSLASAQMPQVPMRTITDPGKITTGQSITPAGLTSVFNGRVNGVTFGANSSEIWLLNKDKIYQLDWKNNRIVSEAATGGAPGLQAIRYQSGGVFFGVTIKGNVQLATLAEGKTKALTEALGHTQSGAIALSKSSALVPLLDEHQLAVVDLKTGALLNRVDVGVVPFGVVVDAAGDTAYVSNWGGRRPKADDPIGFMGPGTNPTHGVVVDPRGIASTGTVTKVDLRAAKVTATIATGLHPTAMTWDETASRLYVANGNQDSISVIDSKTDHLIDTFPIQPFGDTAFGAAPTALALSHDGAKLFVACGGLNAVAILQSSTGKLMGMIPTSWYPSSLALSGDGKYLAIGTLLGPGSGFHDNPKRRSATMHRGSVSVVEVPNPAQLASYTTAVAENNHLSLGSSQRPAANASTAPKAIPNRAGEPSLIEHVVFIIKENRTYDQILGDLGKGNSDPSFLMYGRDVTPNQHKLAEQFVLLDNFFATGGNSADGHQWLTQANETDYCLWPGYQGRSYPFDGTDPIAYSNGGFLWDAALRMKKTVRVYGEFAGSMPTDLDRQKLLTQWREGADFSKVFNVVAPLAPLNTILAANYPSYSIQVPDVVRAKIFLGDLAGWQSKGGMPNLTFISLPSNHTAGATPLFSTARAMVADNDLALGYIVEELTKSRFWPKMAIFVVEDDAQDGVDHVDGHRTVALAISPFTKRGSVDSTFYSQPSMVKTIELILGLPTMSLFDLIAPPMQASFTDTPDVTPYVHLAPKLSLLEQNPPLKATRGQQHKDAVASMAMRWDVPDAVPTQKLNRILWRAAMGMNVKYPGVRHSVFSPMAVDTDDDDR